MNWRQATFHTALMLSGSKIPSCLKSIEQFASMSGEQLAEMQRLKLLALTRHACRNSPYYMKIFRESGLVDDNGSVHLERWNDVPLLTKQTIREHFDELISAQPTRGRFVNTSGGSSGEPVRLLQDRDYRDWNIANKIYYKTFGGQQIGEPELRIWGSERDVLRKRTDIRTLAQNWVYNRTEVNAFSAGEREWGEWAERWKRLEPTWVEAYVQPICEFAQYVKRNNLHLPPPKGIVTSAGTLYSAMKSLLEEVFGCIVLNRYGSREVGDIACSCPHGKGLHLSVWNHLVEILDERGRPVGPGEAGRIHVTTLNNLTQPLIRYDIGDIGVRAGPDDERCDCGRATPLLKWVEGRETSVFHTRDGGVVPAEFFIHFIGVVFNDGIIRRFQVVQKSCELITIRVVLADAGRFEGKKHAIEESIRRVMGDICRVEWEPVADIPPLPNGKYLYTVSEVS